MKKVQIQVVKIAFDEALAEQYLTDGKAAGSCPYYHVGDTFIYEGRACMPDGFCPWAWVDIYHHVNAIAQGASYTPWFNKEGRNLLCCTDGIRTVSFLLERL